MPFHIQVVLPKQLVVARVTGLVEVEDFLEFYRDLEAQVPAGAGFRLYSDGSQAADQPFIATDINLFAATADQVYARIGIIREALIASTSQNLGLAAMYRQFTAGGRDLRIFTRSALAVAWLNEMGGPEITLEDCA